MDKQSEYKLVRALIAKNGEDQQRLVCMEEPAELIQAITKCERYKHIGKLKEYRMCRNNLIEEMADVLFCLDMLRCLYDVSENELMEMKESKEKRTMTRYKIKLEEGE